MGKSHGKGNLSPADKAAILTAYFEEEVSIKKICLDLDRAYTTIYRIIKKEKDRLADEARKAAAAPVVHSAADIPPPLLFMVQNYFEISGDISLTRQRGSVNVLPSLYRLRMDIHSQVQAIMAEQADQTEEDADILLATVLHTIQSLPPIMRHTIHGHLKQLEMGNVIPFSGGGKV